jgi:hypothetical protein
MQGVMSNAQSTTAQIDNPMHRCRAKSRMRLLKKAFSQLAALTVVSRSGGEVKESSQLFRRVLTMFISSMPKSVFLNALLYGVSSW